MALIVPSGPNWAHHTNNLASTPGLPLGTSVTAGANNIDGSVVTLLPALAHDVEYLRIGYAGFTASNVDCSTLLDILVDPAGGTNWTACIDDLLAGYSPALGTVGAATGPSYWYDFPIWIPAGASVGARARTAHNATITGSVFLFVRGGNANPASWWCGQRVQTIGVNASQSHGTGVTPGASPNWSAWTDIGAPIDMACGAVQFAVQGPQGQGGGAYTNTDYWQYGAGGTIIGVPIVKVHTSQEMSWATPSGPMWVSLPAGTQFQARAMADMRSTPTSVDVAVYAVH